MANILMSLVFAVLCLQIAQAASNREEARKKLIPIVEACKTEVGATDADVDELAKKLPASTTQGMCMRACVMKKIKLMDANGKFDKAVALEHSKKYTDGDAEKMKIASEIIDVCGALAVSDNHCEAAAQYGKCLKEQALAHGVDKMEF